MLEDGAWVVRHHFDRAKMVWFGWTAHGAELAGGYECPVCARRGEEDIGRVMADSIEACDDEPQTLNERLLAQSSVARERRDLGVGKQTWHLGVRAC